MSALLTLRAAAAELGISPSLARKLAREGSLPTVTLTEGGDRYVTRKALDAYVAGLERRATASLLPVRPYKTKAAASSR